MASKTLIRSQRQHEVKLDEGSHLAKSTKAQLPDGIPPVVPASIRKAGASAGTSRRTARVASTSTAAKATPASKTPAARSKSRAAASAAPAGERKPAAASKRAAPAKATPSAKSPAAPARPRLPAFVPADGLWEANSAIQQRLQSLIERNAQLSEQLQRMQGKTPLKGPTP